MCSNPSEPIQYARLPDGIVVILVCGKEQCGNEVEDQRRDEQPEKQEERPVRDVAPAVLHPPGDDHC
jgi:hypothetical protein